MREELSHCCTARDRYARSCRHPTRQAGGRRSHKFERLELKCAEDKQPTGNICRLVTGECDELDTAMGSRFVSKCNSRDTVSECSRPTSATAIGALLNRASYGVGRDIFCAGEAVGEDDEALRPRSSR